jgi:hypothetical protein
VAPAHLSLAVAARARAHIEFSSTSALTSCCFCCQDGTKAVPAIRFFAMGPDVYEPVVTLLVASTDQPTAPDGRPLVPVKALPLFQGGRLAPALERRSRYGTQDRSWGC